MYATASSQLTRWVEREQGRASPPRLAVSGTLHPTFQSLIAIPFRTGARTLRRPVLC
jgi:hypothetical protein